MNRLILAAAFLAASGAAVQAGPIERACLSSDRPGATRALCGCIQSVADTILDGSDQRFGVRFFRDPHMAQEIRMSDDYRHSAFWERWKLFGAEAERYCG
jgi:hypothetical protein